MEIRIMPLSAIKPSDYNPRKQLKPEDAQYQKLAASMEEFGYVEPIIWNQDTGNLVGGHQRLSILINSGQTQAEVVVVNLSLHDEKILNVLLNRAKGRWDNDKLAALLNELDEAGAVELTGFDEWELQGLLDDYDRQLGDILNYEPEDGGDVDEEPEEPQTFEMTFSIPIEEQPAVNAYLEAEDCALEQLAETVVL
nr:ParB N-terminal domain-containing protein [Oscillospiraceae bacterium]